MKSEIKIIFNKQTKITPIFGVNTSFQYCTRDPMVLLMDNMILSIENSKDSTEIYRS